MTSLGGIRELFCGTSRSGSTLVAVCCSASQNEVRTERMENDLTYLREGHAEGYLI